LPAKDWLIQHPENWPAAERKQASQWLQAHGIEDARFEHNAALHAGIRVVCGLNMLDASLDGLLADRTLPGNSQRSKAVALPFLGAPALFPDGPFRLAAMLRQKVVFMAGLYRGGRHYDLRFVEIADFGSAAGASATSGAERDLAIRAALERYVATLEAMCREAPYNWFNFYDFWADADAPEPAA